MTGLQSANPSFEADGDAGVFTTTGLGLSGAGDG